MINTKRQMYKMLIWPISYWAFGCRIFLSSSGLQNCKNAANNTLWRIMCVLPIELKGVLKVVSSCVEFCVLYC